MIPVKKIVLSLCLILLGASVLSGCTKDEVLDQYNNIVQSAGSIALTGNSSLQGTKEKGIDDYTGSYTANYEDFSDTEYLFGGTSIKREAGKDLWKCVVVFQGYRFKTISGLPFSYKIKTGRNGELTKELWIDRRESSKSLTWSSVLLALGNIKGEVVDRPKALGDIRGVTYIFGMFYRFGLIDVPDEVKEKMKHPKQNTGKQ